VYQKLSDVMPDDSDVYLRIAQIYRELHQLDKAERISLKRGSTHPEAWKSCTTSHAVPGAGRYEDAVRVLSDAVTVSRGSRLQCHRGGGRWPSSINNSAALSRYAELSSLDLYFEELGIWARKRIAGRG